MSQLGEEPSPSLGLTLDAHLKHGKISQTKHFKLIPGNSGLTVFGKRPDKQFQNILPSEFEAIQRNKYKLIKELFLHKKRDCFFGIDISPPSSSVCCVGKTESAFDGTWVKAPLYSWHNMQNTWILKHCILLGKPSLTVADTTHVPVNGRFECLGAVRIPRPGNFFSTINQICGVGLYFLHQVFYLIYQLYWFSLSLHGKSCHSRVSL